MNLNLNQHNKTKQAGFSLIQLLAGIGIIALMSVMSIPALRQYQPNLKLRGEAKQLVADLRYAQQLTVTEQKVHYIEMNIINAEYKIIKQETPESPIKTVELDSVINFQEILNLTDNKVIFNSYGAVNEAGTIILVNSQGKTSTIQVKPSGYMQLQ